MNNLLQNRVENQLDYLLFQIENLDRATLKNRPIPKKWSIQEHLAHLGRYQEIFLMRMKVILEKEAPLLKRYRADDDKEFQEWCTYDIQKIIEQINLERREIIDFLNKLFPKQLAKIGIHPKLGRMNMEDWTNFFILHEAHHIYAIFALVQRFYYPNNL